MSYAWETQNKTINPRNSTTLRIPTLACNPMFLEVLLVLLILTKQGSVHVNYQLLHTCEPSHTCHSGKRQLAIMYQSIH
jgi:hypothetical protein